MFDLCGFSTPPAAPEDLASTPEENDGNDVALGVYTQARKALCERLPTKKKRIRGVREWEFHTDEEDDGGSTTDGQRCMEWRDWVEASATEVVVVTGGGGVLVCVVCGSGGGWVRLTYRKRHSYATKSNQHRIVKTPGGKLVYQSTKKRASGPKCPVTGKRIQGIPHLRPAEYKRSRLSRNRRSVNRAYGGVLSGGAVRERIIRAFLVEEQKIVKKVLKIQKAKEKQAAKS
ncbi:hypothetical protein Vadar_016994 [Vaccinium darrowii]|uniref:Uncharacterized protein n=1 Tax=Vaccinium darrowii TaxID=229202 RepID=A0ACB7YF71_9ERIC|nr:hypothetical protein Vadar_016994 [Vaccinium darrowii]